VNREKKLQETRDARQRRLRQTNVNAVSSLVRHKRVAEKIRNSEPVANENLLEDQEPPEYDVEEEREDEPEPRVEGMSHILFYFIHFTVFSSGSSLWLILIK
jgi:hypothetical protein